MTYTLEQLAPGLEDATVTTWHVKEGDTIVEDDDMIDVTTDKAVVTIPAPCDGVIQTCHAAQEDTVQSDSLIVSID